MKFKLPKMKFKPMVKTAQTSITKHASGILMVMGIGGMIATVILTAKATPKVLEAIENEKKEKGLSEEDKLPPVDTLKVAWKPYLPAATVGLVSIGCVLGSNSVNAKRIAALTTAYNFSRNALEDYKNAVVETVGEKKEKTIQENASQKTVERYEGNQQIIMTGNGDTLCMDSLTGIEFYSNPDKIIKAVNKFNALLIDEMYGSLNELYEFYDISNLEYRKLGEEVGWHYDLFRSRSLLEVSFDATLTKDQKPCLVIMYNQIPITNYQRPFGSNV